MSYTRRDLDDWLVKAPHALGGSGTVVQVSQWIWKGHESELRSGGDLFFTWQYKMWSPSPVETT